MQSAFPGYIAEIPFILVDNFENKHKSAYFLSHYHGDHVFGLNAPDFPKKLKENNGLIYASEVTVAIIKSLLPELGPYLKILELGRNTVTITDNDEEIYLNVTTLPAGHSLGSIMLLFHYKQTILYTGDFRITRNTLSKYTHLHKNDEPIHIDTLYVDTTFQNVPSFPKRSDVVRNIVQHVRDWLKLGEKYRVVLVTSACFGYECVCNELYKATGVKTYIGAAKWNVFSKFPKEMYGITNDSISRIHLCTKKENTHPDSPEILTIYFSAMKWGYKINDENFLHIIRKNKIEVCFATHCGRDELLHFINYFQAKRVVGFPNPLKTVNSPLKIECKPLKMQLSPVKSDNVRRKRLKSGSESDVGKKISKDLVKSMFDW